MNSAVIIETRLKSNLSEIIRKHIQFLKGWNLTIFCGNENEFILKKDFPDATFFKIVVNSAGDYNRLMTAEDTWQRLPYNKILIFQYDSMILREGIEEFLEWDYVGAPWKFSPRGGNGGLSLRSRNVMLDITRKYPWKGENEDVYFCRHIDSIGGKLAPRNVCEKFSCEVILKDGTLGYHAVRNRYGDKEADRLENQYK